MRILRIFYDWPGTWNGLGPSGYEITKEQLNQGNKITLMCGNWAKNPPVSLPNLNIIPIFREPLEGTIYFTSSILLLIKYLLWRNTYKVDVIHSHGHFAIWIYLYRLIFKKMLFARFEFEPLFVTHFHNTFAGRWDSLRKENKPIKWFSEKIAWPLGVMSDKWAVSSSDLCVFVSQNLLDEAVKFYGADLSKCIVLENGVNTELFKRVNSIEKDKTRKELGYDLFDTVIINYGNMVGRKNIVNLIQSLSYLPIKYKLLLIGSGPKDYKDQIDKVIIDNLLGSRVRRIPYTPYTDLPIPIQSSDIFVLPSDFEGLPKVVLEALSCEIPTLVSGFKFTDHVDGVYYLENKDPKTIAAQIQEISKSEVKMDIDAFRSKFSWKTKMFVLNNLYQRFINEKNAKNN